MTKRFLMRIFAAAVAAVVSLPVAAESFIKLDHNPYGYTIVQKNYNDDIVLDRYGNVYATEKSLNCNGIYYVDDECIVFSRGKDYIFASHDGKEIEKVSYIGNELKDLGYYYAKSLNYLWGIIDKHGKWIIEPSAKDLTKAPFSLSRYHYILKSATIIQYTIKGRFMSR